jgi:hypothetical protein
LRWFLLDDPIFIVVYVRLNLIKVIIMKHHHLYQQNNIFLKNKKVNYGGFLREVWIAT